jgi:hypothetical protein
LTRSFTSLYGRRIRRPGLFKTYDKKIKDFKENPSSDVTMITTASGNASAIICSKDTGKNDLPFVSVPSLFF